LRWIAIGGPGRRLSQLRVIYDINMTRQMRI
jgi:hypothetical protein